jgi:hypothetical protein
LTPVVTQIVTRLRFRSLLAMSPASRALRFLGG